MNKIFTTFISFTLLFQSGVALAAPRTITIPIITKLDVTMAVGTVINGKEFIEIPSVQIDRTPSGVLVSFTIDSSRLTGDSYASATAFSSEGDFIFSNMQSVETQDTMPVAECPTKDLVNPSALNQIGVIQSLVSVRAERRNNAQMRVADILKGEFLERLKRLELGFGLSYQDELSPALRPIDLINRLTRILLAVKNYRAGRAPEEATATPATENH